MILTGGWRPLRYACGQPGIGIAHCQAIKAMALRALSLASAFTDDENGEMARGISHDQPRIRLRLNSPSDSDASKLASSRRTSMALSIECASVLNAGVADNEPSALKYRAADCVLLISYVDWQRILSLADASSAAFSISMNRMMRAESPSPDCSSARRFAWHELSR